MIASLSERLTHAVALGDEEAARVVQAIGPLLGLAASAGGASTG